MFLAKCGHDRPQEGGPQGEGGNRTNTTHAKHTTTHSKHTTTHSNTHTHRCRFLSRIPFSILSRCRFSSPKPSFSFFFVPSSVFFYFVLMSFYLSRGVFLSRYRVLPDPIFFVNLGPTPLFQLFEAFFWPKRWQILPHPKFWPFVGRLLKDVRFYPMLSFVHFWAPSLVTFLTVQNKTP